MFKCANCDKNAVVTWCPPAGEKVPFCADHRPSFTFKPEWEQHTIALPPINEDVVVAPTPVEEAPSEVPAEETPKEAAPKKEPKK